MSHFRYRKNCWDWRRRGAPLLRLIAGACAALVLALGLLAASPAAHHWLHHDSEDKDHECAVVIFAVGLTPAAVTAAVTPVCLVLVAAVMARYRRPDLPVPRYALQPERGPPGSAIPRLCRS